jgi:hypothetical protein
MTRRAINWSGKGDQSSAGETGKVKLATERWLFSETLITPDR